MDGDPTTYQTLLRDAYELGRCDGRAAAEADLQDAAPDDATCRGLGPDGLAAQLWARRPGRPPAGLPLNGPRWYAAGFRAGLAERTAADAVPVPRRGTDRVEAPSAVD